jgi:hypothetical protein
MLLIANESNAHNNGIDFFISFNRWAVGPVKLPLTSYQ